MCIYKRRRERKHIPWKCILSEVQYDQSRLSAKAKEGNLLGLLAEATGVAECVEGSVFASPFAVQEALALRAVAWALVSFCHVGAAKTHGPELAQWTKRSMKW